MGKWPDALNQMQHALEMDPLSPMFGADMSWDLVTMGRYDEAARQLRKTVDLAPQEPYARMLLALALEATGKSAQSLEEAEKTRQLPGMFVMAGSRSGIFCRLGKPEVARDILKQLQAAQKKSYVAPLEIAECHFALGEKKAGLDRLRDAMKERSFSIGFAIADPLFDSVRGTRNSLP